MVEQIEVKQFVESAESPKGIRSKDLFVAENLTYSYKGHQVIHGISLNVHEGEVRAIIGPNGAGKTTLIKLLSGELIPDEGYIWFKHKNITKLSPNKKRKIGISRSFQITNIFFGHTVYENVRLAVQANHKGQYTFWKNVDSFHEIEEETWNLLKQCQLIQVKDTLSSSLSYAEQRQVEIALCLAGKPEMLLLDEPAAGLSKEESKKMASLITSLARNLHLTVIFIEHDMDIVFSISDQISVIYYGKVFMEDVPENIKSDPRIKEIYLGEEAHE
ncbi:branched-chain amino acid transport system ATP-binding protein [Neobacillus sp. B4I6]|jgi:branched-chain amino acid transport system ATP-binding protein|uniref:ABC transporter ATP-binding protein n=1 Tax=Neobacillus sp. B4I6 TaxID=3373925 RepID=UPI003D1E5E83